MPIGQSHVRTNLASGQRRETIRCHHCDRTGHITAQCLLRPRPTSHHQANEIPSTSRGDSSQVTTVDGCCDIFTYDSTMHRSAATVASRMGSDYRTAYFSPMIIEGSTYTAYMTTERHIRRSLWRKSMNESRKLASANRRLTAESRSALKTHMSRALALSDSIALGDGTKIPQIDLI